MSNRVAHNRESLVGMRFSKLTVVGSLGSRAYGETKCKKAIWACVCDCGKEAVVDTGALKSGNTKSCGCGSLDALRSRAKPLKSKYKRTYRIWQAMLNRCRNKNTPGWHRYGGRGISVCDSWLSFENFIGDMGPAPSDHSIERVDNDGNYVRSNCKWATRSEQSLNRSSNRKITFRGITKPLKCWADDLGIDQASLRERIDKWDLKSALTTPKRGTHG